MKYTKYSYQVTGKMISLGKVKEFKDLANHIPKTTFCKQIKIGYKRTLEIFGDNIESLTIREMQDAANLLEVDFDQLLEIVIRQFKKEKVEIEKKVD